jgi:Uma2 family endonuclease
MNPPHAMAISLATQTMSATLGPTWFVRTQLPLVFQGDTDPEPDLAIVPGHPRQYSKHPSSAALVIEIADTSLKFDTTEKVRLYAKAGIPEYWVLDLNGRQLLVYRDPNSAAFDYSTKLTLTDRDTVQPTAQPQATIKISDLLP